MKDQKPSRRDRLSERLAMLPHLLEVQRWNQKELMEYFGVDRKTIISSLDALSLPGQPPAVIEEPEGRNIYYRLSEDYKGPRLTLRESTIVLLAQEAIGATGLLGRQSPFAPHARSLFKKVRASLPGGMHARLDAMAQVYGAATAPAKDFARYGETIEQLVTAAIEHRTVRMRYYSIGKDKTTNRDVDPYAVYFDPDGATLKLIGWNYEQQKFTPFSIDHIRHLKITNRRFTPRRFNLREHLETYCFNGIHDEPMTVRLRAYGETARVFAERKFHPTQRRLPGPPDTTTIEMRVARGRGLVRFILSWVPDIEVLSPEGLRRAVAEAIRRGAERNKVD